MLKKPMPKNKICYGLAALVLGLGNCYYPPEELSRSYSDAGVSAAVDGGNHSSLTIKSVKPESCREWVIGKEELTICEYDTNNDGKPDSLLQYLGRENEIHILKARDSDGDGSYDRILSQEMFIRIPEVEITPEEIPIPNKSSSGEIFL